MGENGLFLAMAEQDDIWEHDNPLLIPNAAGTLIPLEIDDSVLAEVAAQEFASSMASSDSFLSEQSLPPPRDSRPVAPVTQIFSSPPQARAYYSLMHDAALQVLFSTFAVPPNRDESPLTALPADCVINNPCPRLPIYFCMVMKWASKSRTTQRPVGSLFAFHWTPTALWYGHRSALMSTEDRRLFTEERTLLRRRCHREIDSQLASFDIVHTLGLLGGATSADENVRIANHFIWLSLKQGV